MLSIHQYGARVISLGTFLGANGLDNEAVKSIYDEDEVKSVGNGQTFRYDLIGEEEIRENIKPLCESVAKRLRIKNLKCITVQVQIKDPNLRVIQRQKKLEKPTYLSREILKCAMDIIKESWNLSLPVRMITITGSNLIKENEINEQLSLFDVPDEKRIKTEKLERTLDILENKFGKNMMHIRKKEDENES